MIVRRFQSITQKGRVTEMELAVRMQGITKTFGSKAIAVKANTNVDLDVYKGEILSLLGENGSGKTTLMNMLAGIYYPDSGSILIDGREVSIRSPHDAQKNGIGMVHQHFKLVDVLTAAENIALGVDVPTEKQSGTANAEKKPKKRMRFDLSLVENRMREICEQYGFDLDPKQKVYRMRPCRGYQP